MSDKEESINTFLAMTNIQDYGIAMDYLEKNDWDLTKAVDQYISTHDFREQDYANINQNSNLNSNPMPGSMHNLNDMDMPVNNPGGKFLFLSVDPNQWIHLLFIFSCISEITTHRSPNSFRNGPS